MVMRVWIGVASDLRDRIERPLRRGVITQYAIAFADLFESANGVRFGLSTMPHFLALYEERIPVVVVRVGAKYPIMSLRSRSCHRGVESAAIYTGKTKKRNKIWGLVAFGGRMRQMPQKGK
jgi:hypothetical protein